MAPVPVPGVFCVWSRANPDADSDPPHPHPHPHPDVASSDEAILFTDQIASLQGVSRGVRMQASDQQSAGPPFTHDIPFLAIYELPDVAYCQEAEFRDVKKQCAGTGEGEGVAPRVYELVEMIEAEEYKGDTVIGELVVVVTGEGFPEGGSEAFWTFHRDEFVASFMQAPEFIRAQVYKITGNFDPQIKNAVPGGPYLFVYHWDCMEVPWSEVVAAAQTKGYIKHIESGIKWQGVNYHPYQYTERPVERERGSEYEESEEEDQEVETPRVGNTVADAAVNGTDSTKLSGALNALSIQETES
ncbi:hypothetical protein BCR34DRAFT_561796 [Clohesyomyces aquaticus]|uniref:Uncharacterized protein n=1 Tax=Clohesyomyces aquaticus TaxID=1231657 RepID=A0A1Y1ZU77_9PLEO|nr:hypothetical protein BCR34DRAFT_561796 [Clohesyomyces aquaticus]